MRIDEISGGFAIQYIRDALADVKRMHQKTIELQADGIDDNVEELESLSMQIQNRIYDVMDEVLGDHPGFARMSIVKELFKIGELYGMIR